MGTAADEVAALLAATSLANGPLSEVEAAGWDAPLVAIDVNGLIGGDDEQLPTLADLSLWQEARTALAGSQWTPVVGDASLFAGHLSGAASILPQEAISGEPDRLGDPRWSLDQQWVSVPGQAGFDWHAEELDEVGTGRRSDDNIHSHLEHRARRLEQAFGRRPSELEIREATTPTGAPLRGLTTADWWLHQWLMANVAENQIVNHWRRRSPCYTFCDDAIVVLFPSDEPAIAGHLPTNPGQSFPGRDGHLAWATFTKKWERTWEAELCATGYMPLFTVGQPPTTIADALPLAIEHIAFSDQPSRSGTSVYEYAYFLVNNSEWSLSVKP